MISVKGIIGNEKGQFSLVRLISAVKKEPQNKPLHIMIDSPGGDGELAFGMHDYLRGLKRTIITECTGMCASAASILFLSGDKRIAGCPVMIHNPWMDASGDSEQLRMAADWIEKFEKRTEKFYSEKTGLDSATLSSLMRAETYMSPTQAVELGFATSSRQIAKALIHNANQFQTNMTKKTEKKGRIARAIAILMGEDDVANMLDLTAANGDIIVIDREEGEPQVGDAATPDGSHVMPDGSTIVIADGVITEIIPPESEPGSEEEMAQLRKENEDLKTEIAAMKATAKTQDEMAQLNAIKMAGGSDWLAKQCSTYKPATRKAVMAKEVEEKPLSKTAQKLAEIKKERGL